MKKVTCLAVPLAFLGSIYQPSNAQDKPNIIIIMADDLGYGDISCYGNKETKTPNIDQLAAEGILFTDFHSNGAVCSPTRAALLTGKYQQRTGIEGVVTAKRHRGVGLSLDEITIAEEFKKHGYHTGMFGKWHLGYSKEYNPVLQGFDDFTGYVSGNVDYHAHIDQEGYLDWWDGKTIDNENGYSTDLITRYGVEFIKANNPEKTHKPFLLYLPHEAPHYPYQKRDSRVLREVGEASKLKSPDEDSIPFIYKRMVEIMDEGIGEIVQTLKETGQYESTILLFLSDNGAGHNGNNGVLRGYKGEAYEGGTRVPAIITYPGVLKKGVTNMQTVYTMDLLPTLLDFIDEKPSGNVDGISIKKNLIQQSDLPERDLFFSYKNRSYIRSGEWKLVRLKKDDGEVIELYNLSNDLGEKNDVGADHPALKAEMLQKLNKWEKEVRSGVKALS